MKKTWAEMTDDEREDFMSGLDRVDDNNSRKWREHIILLGDQQALADAADYGELPPTHSGDKILRNFYSGKEPYEGKH